MDLPALQQRLLKQLRRQEDLPTHERDDIEILPLLNYGGFVNRSFRVDTGTTTFHAKVTRDAGGRRGLQRWRALGDRLADAYLAPALLGWLDLAGTDFAGAMFAWIDGVRPDALEGTTRGRVIDAVRRLHTDDDLAAELVALGAAERTCAAAYRATYQERFLEDLQFIRTDPPPFVDGGLLDWMDEQVERLAKQVATTSAFGEPAAAACHRDLWLDNLLTAGTGSVFILDWDEIGLGDPMMDWAMLFGPSRTGVRPARSADLQLLGPSRAERERYELLARASVLDWTIDPLADWVAAADEPEHGAAVRASNRRVHTEALRIYRTLYP